MELIYKYKSNVDTLHLINASNKKVIYCFSSMAILTSIASQYCCYSQEKNIDLYPSIHFCHIRTIVIKEILDKITRPLLKFSIML